MIRKIIIALLVLATLASAVIWVDSYRFHPWSTRAFIGPYVFGDNRRCRFRDVRDHTWYCGWHLERSRLGASRSHNICVIAPRGEVFLRWTTAIPAASPPATRHPTECGGLGVDYREWHGSQWDNVARTPQAYVGHRLRFPIAYLLVLFGGYPVLILIRRPLRRRRRLKRGLCVTCGYDLRGSPERCPECGSKRL